MPAEDFQIDLVAVLGSARSDGHAARVLDAVIAEQPAGRFDLGMLRIRDYTYGHPAEGDDFLEVVEAMVEADAVLFATPVYWYAMSGILKRFFDRLTDLVTVRRPLGRQLAGRAMWVVACGSGPELPEGFEAPFRGTADYFDMEYGGTLYIPTRGGLSLLPEHQRQADAFRARIFGQVRDQKSR